MPVLPVKQVESPPSVEAKPEITPTPNSEIHVISTLPSNFMAYDGIKQIEVRALNLGELKYLNSGGLTRRDLVNMYKSVILNYDVNKLTWSDFSYIVSHIAVFTTESAFWKFSAVCRKCKAPVEIKLSKDSFVQYEDTSALKGYPITATINGHELDFGFITVEKYLKLLDKIPDMDEQLRIFYGFAAMVINKDIDEAYNLMITSTSYDDGDLLTRIAELLYHDTLPMKWTCSHCGHSDEYKVDVEVSTVSPFRDDTTSIEDRISFGKRSK